VIFGTALSGHHRFRLTDHETGLTLENSLEIHLLELPRYTLNEMQLANASPVARWSYWLSHAHEYDAETLRQLFPEEGFRRAITTIETIAFKTEDKQMYDTREKAARDQQWLINGARMDGREEGRVEGLREGVELGQLVGIVRNCQSLLGLPETSAAELMRLSFDELSELAQLFKQKVRSKA
jgi:flagellar biosynthesis/type III secretory pathway protein FliH